MWYKKIVSLFAKPKLRSGTWLKHEFAKRGPWVTQFIINGQPYGKFDAVFCSGVLYHLPEPWKLIEQLSNISSNLLLWTHYASEEMADQVVNTYRGWWYPEGGTKDPLAGLSPKSFWLTLESLKEMLIKYDFKFIDYLKIDTQHENGPCVTLAVSKDEFARTQIV